MGYLDHLVHWYDLSTPVGNPDLGIPGGNDAVGANIASNPSGVGGGICAEFNGNNSNYNLGDVAMLNEATALTIAFWMNQDVLDRVDIIFFKEVMDGIRIFTHTNGNFYWYFIANGIPNGNFDYSLVIDAATWHHVAWVFDGSESADADRLKCYVDATPVTLGITGTIPATIPDLSGIDAFIGLTNNSFDGKLDTFMIFDTPLQQIQVQDLLLRTRRGML